MRRMAFGVMMVGLATAGLWWRLGDDRVALRDPTLIADEIAGTAKGEKTSSPTLQAQ